MGYFSAQSLPSSIGKCRPPSNVKSKGSEGSCSVPCLSWAPLARHLPDYPLLHLDLLPLRTRTQHLFPSSSIMLELLYFQLHLRYTIQYRFLLPPTKHQKPSLFEASKFRTCLLAAGWLPCRNGRRLMWQHLQIWVDIPSGIGLWNGTQATTEGRMGRNGVSGSSSREGTPSKFWLLFCLPFPHPSRVDAYIYSCDRNAETFQAIYPTKSIRKLLIALRAKYSNPRTSKNGRPQDRRTTIALDVAPPAFDIPTVVDISAA
jgi:hypothetical protein